MRSVLIIKKPDSARLRCKRILQEDDKLQGINPQNTFFVQIFVFSVGRFGLSRLNLYSKHLPYTAGVKVLDLGCGPGTSTHFFRKEDYLGIDIDKDYIDAAKSRYPNYSFECTDFTLLTPQSHLVPSDGFDLILAYGLMHHLDDDLCQKFFEKSNELLQQMGTLYVLMDVFMRIN